MKFINILHKEEYYDAIADGDAQRVMELSEQNYDFPTKVFEASENYSDAKYNLYYQAICMAAEFSLIAIQSGLPDVTAWNIRDEFVLELNKAVSMPELYDLIHGMAHEFAIRVKQAQQEITASPRLRSMMRYISENLTQKISLQDVADAAYLSRTYASAVFKRELGMSMNEYILRERIARACRMLRDNKLTISQIAEQLQFCSQSYFTKCFEQIEGKTPNEYRSGR